jgi:hypothetical protein
MIEKSEDIMIYMLKFITEMELCYENTKSVIRIHHYFKCSVFVIVFWSGGIYDYLSCK